MSSFVGGFAERAAALSGSVEAVLELYLNAATWGGSRHMNLSGGVTVARGRDYEPRIITGGWGGLSRGIDVKATGVPRIATTVKLADTDGAVRDALEAAPQRGSRAWIYWMVPGSTTDCALRFSGILLSWSYELGAVTLSLGTDDRWLESELPAVALSLSDWPNMPPEHVGVYAPIVYGAHDSSGLTNAGAVECIPIYVLGGTIWIALVCLGAAKRISRLFVEGVRKTEGVDYTVEYGYPAGGKRWTIVSFTNRPADNARITADVEGYDNLADTGAFNDAPTGSTITNPVAQIRHLLVNHALNGYNGGAWNNTTTRLDEASWNVCEAWASTYGLEGSGYLGGDTRRERVRAIFEAWLESYPSVRPFWTVEGTLGLRVLDLRWPGYRPTDDPLLKVEDQIGPDCSYSQDDSYVYDVLTATFRTLQAEGKAYGAASVADPSVGEGRKDSLAMEWSGTRAETPGSGSYAITGTDADLRYFRLVAGAGAYAVAGADATLVKA